MASVCACNRVGVNSRLGFRPAIASTMAGPTKPRLQRGACRRRVERRVQPRQLPTKFENRFEGHGLHADIRTEPQRPTRSFAIGLNAPFGETITRPPTIIRPTYKELPCSATLAAVVAASSGRCRSKAARQGDLPNPSRTGHGTSSAGKDDGSWKIHAYMRTTPVAFALLRGRRRGRREARAKPSFSIAAARVVAPPSTGKDEIRGRWCVRRYLSARD